MMPAGGIIRVQRLDDGVEISYTLPNDGGYTNLKLEADAGEADLLYTYWAMMAEAGADLMNEWDEQGVFPPLGEDEEDEFAGG